MVYLERKCVIFLATYFFGWTCVIFGLKRVISERKHMIFGQKWNFWNENARVSFKKMVLSGRKKKMCDFWEIKVVFLGRSA